MNSTGDGLRVTGIDITAYAVKDGPRAVAFYRDVLGLPLLRTYGEQGEQGAEFEFPGGATFGVWAGGDEYPFRPSSGVMFAVEDFDGAVATARERGVPVKHVEDLPSCRMALCEDPDGNEFILHRRKT